MRADITVERDGVRSGAAETHGAADVELGARRRRPDADVAKNAHAALKNIIGRRRIEFGFAGGHHTVTDAARGYRGEHAVAVGDREPDIVRGARAERPRDAVGG